LVTGKEKGVSKLVTGKEYGVPKVVTEIKRGSQIWLRKKRSASGNSLNVAGLFSAIKSLNVPIIT
jgi:hypothetical protein